MIVEWEAGRPNLSPVVGADLGNGERTIQSVPLDATDLWQYDLWRLVREEVDAEPWPVMVENMLANPSLLQSANLPPRLLVAGLQSLSVRHVRALQLLSHHMAVEVVLVHPSPALASQWALDASRVSVSAGIAPEPVRINSFDDNVDSMVSMWLRGAHDAQMVLASQGTSPALQKLSSVEGADDLLHSLHNAVRHGVASPINFTPGDQSFQVHRAHNLGRQVEIARDAIIHAFHDIPDLEPHEVVVFCADVEAASPLLEAAFGREVGGKPLPFIVADRGLRHVDEGASLLDNLLTVVMGRFSIADIMTVATSPLVMQKFGASDDDVSSWYRLIERTRIRWGSTADHRKRMGVQSDENAHTWIAGLHRALVGALLPDAEPDIDFGGAVPLPDLDAADLESVGRLSAIVSAMSSLELLANTTAELSVVQWADAVEETLSSLAIGNKGELDDAREAIDTLRGYVRDARGADIPDLTVTFEHFVEQLKEQISSAPGRQPLRTGAVTATSAVPLRGVPFKVVCLLGFDEGTMRTGETEGDDLTTRQIFMGDIDPRIDQRRSILDAICAASHRVVITCNGRSIKNNAEVPLITPLAELLDLCERCGVEEDPNNKGFLQVEYQHPRHFSSPLNFIKGKIVPEMVWSHDDVALRSITEEHSKTQAAIEADIAVARMAEMSEENPYRVISPRELESFMRDPLSAFVRSGLGINTWNNEEDDEPATIPLELTQKEVGQLRSNLASAVQSGFTSSHWSQVNTAVGNIPMGAYGSQLTEEIVGRVDELSQIASDWGIHLEELIPFEIRIPYAGGEVAGNLMLYPASEKHVAIVDLGKMNGNKAKELQASMGLKLLLLHAMGHEVDGGLVVVVDGKGIDAKVVWHYVQLDPNMTSDSARNRVVAISQLFEVAVRSPYPMFGKTAELVNSGEIGKAEKAFDAVVGLDLELEDGRDYGYLQKQECLVFGLTPKFEELFVEGSEIPDFFSTFFETIVKQSDALKKELKLGNRKDPAGNASRKRYLYA
jgi:exodeoxyribonuclease V gamma subunit